MQFKVNRIFLRCWIILSIKYICFLLQKFERWEIQHVYREANQAAHWVASVSHLVDSSMVIINQRYSRLNEILYYDASGMIFARKST